MTQQARIALFCAAILTQSGCAGYRVLPLAERPALAPSVALLDRTRPGGLPPITADQALSVSEVGFLAAQNSPDLRAIRSQRRAAQAQVIQAGLLPDPTLSTNYGVLLAGPGFANAIGATLSGAGTIDGRSPEFMESYDPKGEWYVPKPFRPRLVVLEVCAPITAFSHTWYLVLAIFHVLKGSYLLVIHLVCQCS